MHLDTTKKDKISLGPMPWDEHEKQVVYTRKAIDFEWFSATGEVIVTIDDREVRIPWSDFDKVYVRMRDARMQS